ncbi:MAG TPA: 4Fe-4S binding protein [Chryseolinea sp.]|nr:4Fe-4S binding protein [Chryseolinea sp.]
MKILKTSGLALFLFGFLLFNALIFFGTYQLRQKIVNEKITDTLKRELFIKSSHDLIGRTFTSQFAFVSNLKSVFRTINESQFKRYRIRQGEIDTLISLNHGTFSIKTIDSVFNSGSDITIFKSKMLKQHASSLEGQSLDSQQLRSELQGFAETIEKYNTINQVGFDRYQINDLGYSFTKASALNLIGNSPILFLLITFGCCIAGSMLYILPKLKLQPGIKNNGIFFSVMKNTGWLGILTGTWLILFYLLLYFYPEYITNWVMLVDPISKAISGHEAGRFFLYGFIYTLCVIVMGVRMMIHYRHSKYQLLRTVSVMFFQLCFAFLIPEILIRLNKPYFDFKNIWPLDYTFFFDYRLNELIASGGLGVFMLGWGIALTIVAVPVMVYFFGKRWYCSWVCGCGGLAETLGDPFRHLSNKSLKAWKIERWMVHGVLALAVLMTAGVLYTFFTGASWFLFFDSYVLREIYGVAIGSIFAGVVGTGFYPLMGNRVWCRFGCPLAAYLGLIQRFKSRFRITTNGGQCISCGNCSTYCEMGIDVRWYAQRGQNIVRSSCVGCGVCSSVCPRGVLNLEVKDEEGRFGKPVLIGNNKISLPDQNQF